MICVPLFQLSPRKHSPGSEAWHRDRWTGQGRGEGREVMCNSPCSQQVSYAGRRTSTRIYTLSFKSSAGGLAGLPAQAGTILREIPYISPDGHPRWVSSVQSFSRVWFFETPWTAALQASLPITNSWSLLKLMSIESVMPSNHLILCRPLLLLPSSFLLQGLFQWVCRIHKIWSSAPWGRTLPLPCPDPDDAATSPLWNSAPGGAHTLYYHWDRPAFFWES